MSNPLFNSLGGQGRAQQPSNMQNVLGRLQQFQRTFQGNPQQMAQNMMNQMPQERINQAIEATNQLYNALFHR